MARIPGYLIRLALALPAAGPLHAAADDLRELRDGGRRHEWVPVRVDEKRAIRTWAKLEDGKRVRSWKVDAWVDAPIEAIARLHTDMTLMPRWYWETEEARMLKVVSRTEFYYYMRFNAPWACRIVTASSMR